MQLSVRYREQGMTCYATRSDLTMMPLHHWIYSLDMGCMSYVSMWLFWTFAEPSLMLTNSIKLTGGDYQAASRKLYQASPSDQGLQHLHITPQVQYQGGHYVCSTQTKMTQYHQTWLLIQHMATGTKAMPRKELIRVFVGFGGLQTSSDLD